MPRNIDSDSDWLQTALRQFESPDSTNTNPEIHLGSVESQTESEQSDTMSETASTPGGVDGIEDVRVSPEIEWPAANGPEPTFADVGHDSNVVKRQLPRELETAFGPTYVGGDGTIGSLGAELSPSSEVHLSGDEARRWFREVIQQVEDRVGRAYEPTGLMDSSGTSAGLHLHLSPLTEEQAEELFDMSQDPWLMAFTGSSIAADPLNAKVFRDTQYCDFHSMDRSYSAVKPRSTHHYEWRLPEPMRPDHFDHLITMLDRWLRDGRDAAREYAISLMQQDDSPVTAVRRAEEVGIADALESRIQVTLDRTPHPDTVEFYNTVRSMDDVPYIFRATVPEGEYYYFHSFEGAETANLPDFGLSVEHGMLVRAEDLQAVDDPDVVDAIETAFNDLNSSGPFAGGMNEPETTDATDFLLDTMS